MRMWSKKNPYALLVKCKLYGATMEKGMEAPQKIKK